MIRISPDLWLRHHDFKKHSSGRTVLMKNDCRTGQPPYQYGIIFFFTTCHYCLTRITKQADVFLSVFPIKSWGLFLAAKSRGNTNRHFRRQPGKNQPAPGLQVDGCFSLNSSEFSRKCFNIRIRYQATVEVTNHHRQIHSINITVIIPVR